MGLFQEPSLPWEKGWGEEMKAEPMLPVGKDQLSKRGPLHPAQMVCDPRPTFCLQSPHHRKTTIPMLPSNWLFGCRPHPRICLLSPFCVCEQSFNRQREPSNRILFGRGVSEDKSNPSPFPS